MKGMIFTEFLDMVDEEHGLAAKHSIISKAAVANDGAYTSVGDYDVHELVRLVVATSEHSQLSVGRLLNSFGERIFIMFTQRYGAFFKDASGSFEFLSRIENYIHVEVRKLYPNAELPEFSYPVQTETMLVMEYSSPRPLAAFAEGLIRGCIKHFKESVQLEVEDLSGGKGTSARFTLRREPRHG